MNIGTSVFKSCPVCGYYTMDTSGECHYAYCDEEQVDDMEGEREFMRGEAAHRELTEDEHIIYGV